VWAKAAGDATIVVYYAASEAPSPPPVLQLEGQGGSYAVTVVDPQTGEATERPEPIVAEQNHLRLPAPPDGQDWVVILRRK